MTDLSNPRGAGKPKGQVKTGGRQKGTKNRKTLAREAGLKSLGQELKKHRFDVVAELVKIYEDGETTTDQRLSILTMIMDRVSPKLAPMKVEPRVESEQSDVVLEAAVQAASDEKLLKSLEEE